MIFFISRGDAKTFWMELEDDGKVDFIFEQVQNVLQSLKQKIKDGSATNKEYIQAMILVKDATINHNSTLIKDHTSVTQNAEENKLSSLPSTSYEDFFPKDCTYLSTENQEIPLMENKDADFREKESSLNLSYQKHECSGTCLMKMPFTFKGENPLQLPVKCHFQRRHAKTNSHSSALHVSYKTPCGRSLRNMEEVFRYLLETECNFLFTDNFSFNTYVQLTRNYPKEEEIVSDVDISNGVESVPISFCNEIDNRKLPQFKYRKTMWPRAYYLNSFSSMFTDSCDCSEGCVDITKCACLQLTARNARTCPLSSNKITTGYKYKRLERQIPTGIYECSLLCKCDRRMCQNRVVQHGPQVRLQVFKTEKKGWGVRCLDDIDRGTFVCIYSGRLLSRSDTEKPDAIDENGKEENIMKNMFSKKRKIEVADCEVEVIPIELEARPRSMETQEYPPKFHNNTKEPIIGMKYNSIARIRYHSVIRSPKTKTVIIQHNGKNMGFTSSEAVTSEDNGELTPAQEHLNSKAKEMRKDSSSNQVEDCEDKPVIESDVIDITKCREDTPPGDTCHQAVTLDNKNEVQIQKPQEEKSPACQNQQVFFGKELPNEIKDASSDSLEKCNKGNVFLLDATKEGNVGRFLNHSCCPNLLVQNVFVETHDRSFPLVAFFTNSSSNSDSEVEKLSAKPRCASPAGEIHQLDFAKADFRRRGSSAQTWIRRGLPRPSRPAAPAGPRPTPRGTQSRSRPLYSSALVECEDYDSSNNDRNFDVESVKKEIKRGRKLKCTFCGKKGATVGCDLKSCFKNYHFFCAKNDHAVLQADGRTGIYKVFCQQHADPQNDLPLMKPLSGVFHSHYSEQTKPRHGVKRKRGRSKRHHVQDPNVAAAAVQNAVQCCAVACDEKQRAPIQTTLDRFLKRVDRIEPSKEPEPVPSTSGPPERMALKKEKDGRHTDAIVKAAFLKKCKEAGLLDALFEEILDKLHLIQERLMDETTAESDYEDIGTSLFDCRLFEDTLVNFQAVENHIHESEERRRQLKEEIELLQDLKQTLCSGLQSSSTSDSSLSS
ncbi:histone-lysine N-methyltransferase SETDB2 isoform X9 [Ovis aries]|uniref:histone-lysine N-methyltransferase SETDB2 isoform X9 n=1 Tax=Ovis aries TaxID=9940 RepID=UPI001C2EE466|nr:histone-lysine N-methyltransferase SETDB2 isoform X9 [Ovis aries]XP_060250326.1 histone-lysine N-methyltransferase SETDB2 isoform X9 [Ovis aries]